MRDDSWFKDCRCKICGQLGPTVVSRELDGGGPGNFWITKLRCKRCGHVADDAYHDGSEWQRDMEEVNLYGLN